MSLPVTMASFHVVNVCAIFAFTLVLVSGETCLSPKHTSEVYTTTESTVSESTVFIVEFTLTCKNNVQGLNLYAEMNGMTLPASRVEGTSKYQVSFSGTHKLLPAGMYNVRVFDEEGYGDLRKAQRSGDDASAVKSLFTVKVDHQGASKGLWVDSVIVATGVSVLTFYVAYSAKQKLEKS